MTMADLTPVTLRDPSSALSAVYIPGAGMLATSLSDGGTELLGQRRGLDAYVSAGKTMGIPLLYPWANRLSAKTYNVDGETVTLSKTTGLRPTGTYTAKDQGILAVVFRAQRSFATAD